MSETEHDDGNRFKKRIHWRDTMREPRLVIFDARVVFFFLILAVHLRVWTAILLVSAMLVFWLVERAGYRFPSAMRAIRSTFAGTHRPAFYQHNYREAVDYGYEFRKMSSSAPVRSPKERTGLNENVKKEKSADPLLPGDFCI